MDTAANEIIDKVSAQRDEVMEICAQTQAMLGKALDQRDELRAALEGLLADITEYQTINKLGGKNNHWQVIARAALAKVPK